MAYERVNWKNEEEEAITPLNAHNLNIMDKGIADAHSLIEALKNMFGPAKKGVLGLTKPDGVTTRTLPDGTMVAIGGGGPDRPTEAVEVNYNNYSSGLDANNVQDAVDEVTTRLSDVEEDTEQLTAKLSDNIDKGFLTENIIKEYLNSAYVEFNGSNAGKIIANSAAQSVVFYGKAGRTYTVSASRINRSVLARYDNYPTINGEVGTFLLRNSDVNIHTFTVKSDGWYVWYIHAMNSSETIPATNIQVVEEIKSNREITQELTELNKHAIKVGYGKSTTSANGNLRIEITSGDKPDGTTYLSSEKYGILSAISQNVAEAEDDTIVFPYKYNNGLGGNWGLHVVSSSASMSAVVNKSIPYTIYYYEK